MSIMLQSSPSEWKLEKLGHIFFERKEKVSDKEYPPLSVTKNGIVPQMDNVAKSDDSENRKLVRKGDFVINSRSDRKGSSGLSVLDGSVSLINLVLCPRYGHPKFIHYLMKSYAFQEEFYRFGRGIVADLWTTRFSELKRIPVAVPPPETQKAIADFLDRETARIDALIAKKEKIIFTISEKIESLVDKAISDKSLPWARLEHLTNRVFRQVDLSKHEELIRLGLYNRGRGIFKKPASDEEGMGDSQFSYVQEGDLILSGQFAWEGAVALVTQEEQGCVVSHRYPIYRAKDGISSSYLLSFFRSDFGDFVLNDASRGSAGRNRPLNTNRLAKEKIPIAGKDLQKEIEDCIYQERFLKQKITLTIQKLKEYKKSLITEAITGQLDISNFQNQTTPPETTKEAA